MASYSAYLNLINLPVRKSYTVNERANPFDELDDDEFRKRFRLTKATALLRYCFLRWTIYSTCTSTVLVDYNIEFTIDQILIHYKSEIPATRAYELLQAEAAAAGLVQFILGVLYVVAPKLVESRDMCCPPRVCKFDDLSLIHIWRCRRRG